MLINREKAIAAVEALLAKMAQNRYDRADNSLAREVECISEQVTEALRALPVSDGVTGGMIERAARAIVKRNWPSLADSDVDHMWPDHAEDVRAALEAALGATVSDGWEDIATAPKDGTEVLVFIAPKEVCLGWYYAPSSRTYGWRNVRAKIITPTHWKPLGPLPAPPTIE